MGIFKHIQDEIDDREKREGISLADLLDLPPSLRRLMNHIVRQGGVSLEAAAELLEQAPDEVGGMLDELVGKGYLEREKREGDWIYRVRYARKRGRTIPPGIWSALGDKKE